MDNLFPYSGGMSTSEAPPLRKDARRNREAILVAARELFAESSDVPMYEIAKRAGVGQATLYRNFPDRSAIVAALFTEILDRLEGRAAEYDGDPDAFIILLRSIVDSQVQFHGLADVLRGQPGEEPDLDRLRQRLTDLLRKPLRQAKAAGTIRRDLTPDDVILVAAMIEGALFKANSRSDYGTAASRALTLIVDGLATSGST
jgi:AcrR family transcriptional regulator